MKKLILVLFAVAVAVSCKKVEHQPYVDWGDFYPTENTFFELYKSTERTVDVLAGIDQTSTYRFRKTVSDQFSETADCQTFAVNLDRLDSKSSEWVPFETFSVSKYEQKILRTENNVCRMVLNFPAVQDSQWDLNKFNNQPKQMAKYAEVFTRDTIDNFPYDSVLVVVWENNKTMYSFDYEEERYAKGVGLISKKSIHVESQPNQAKIDLSLPIERRITKGTVREYTIEGPIICE